ncbi:MAG: hypothetical protein J6Y24_08695 [Bacteroidales bacterium]|nr:hypothetical protein [Bacteroidales bacterium]
MRTNLLLFSLFASVMLASSAVAQNRADSTFIDAEVETYTPNFDKVSPLFEQFLEQNSVRIEEKTKDYYVITYSLVMWKSQFADLKNRLDEWKCQTIKLKETTRYIPREKMLLQDRFDEDEDNIREYQNEIRELDSKNGTVVLDIKLMRELTTPSASMKIRFVNMPGFEFSVFMPENPKEGVSADMYYGYMLKYLFTKGKSYITVGAFKADEVLQNDTLMYSDIFNFSFGQDFYSRHLGRGGRKFLNLYSGYNIGYLVYSGKNSSLKNFYVSPAVGIELFKNNFMLIDTKMTYMLPFTDNLYLRGFQFAAAVNFVF